MAKKNRVGRCFLFFLKNIFHLATSFLGHQSITNSMLMTLSFSFLSLHATSHKTFNSYKTPFLKSRPGWLPTFNPSKTEFLLIGLPTQLAKIENPSLSMTSNTSIKPVASARNLGVIFDSNLSFSDHISYISKTCLLTFMISDVFAILKITLLPALLQLHLFIPNLTTAIHCF